MRDVFSGQQPEPQTADTSYLATAWERQNHDVVLVDMRGTGEGHRLDCQLGADDELQAYLVPIFFEGSRFSACREELEKQADLTQYTTPLSMQDLDEVRQALGYGKIHALLSGLVPLANRSPLFHGHTLGNPLPRVDRQAAVPERHGAGPGHPLCRGPAQPALRATHGSPAHEHARSWPAAERRHRLWLCRGENKP